MDYYISWAAAELPFDESRLHYTEELVLMPSHISMQYFTPRSANGVSVHDGHRFDGFSRRALRRPRCPEGGVQLVPMHAEAIQAAASL